MKVLIIDDASDLIEVVSLCFEMRWPHSTLLTAETGEEGIRLAETERPDMVILDVVLPNKDGFQVCRDRLVTVELQLVGAPALGDGAQVLSVALHFSQGDFGFDVGHALSGNHPQDPAPLGVQVAHHLAGIVVWDSYGQLYDGLQENGVCIGEDEERSPWEPFHVSRGFKAEESTVTVAAIQDPEILGNRYGTTGESVMDATADAMAMEASEW